MTTAPESALKFGRLTPPLPLLIVSSCPDAAAIPLGLTLINASETLVFVQKYPLVADVRMHSEYVPTDAPASLTLSTRLADDTYALKLTFDTALNSGVTEHDELDVITNA